MKKIKNYFLIYFKNISGATAVEYGLIVAAIALALMALIFAFGDNFNLIFENLISIINPPATP